MVKNRVCIQASSLHLLVQLFRRVVAAKAVGSQAQVVSGLGSAVAGGARLLQADELVVEILPHTVVYKHGPAIMLP